MLLRKHQRRARFPVAEGSQPCLGSSVLPFMGFFSTTPLSYGKRPHQKVFLVYTWVLFWHSMNVTVITHYCLYTKMWAHVTGCVIIKLISMPAQSLSSGTSTPQVKKKIFQRARNKDNHPKTIYNVSSSSNEQHNASSDLYETQMESLKLILCQ